jgi:subtilisin family serine protease
MAALMDNTSDSEADRPMSGYEEIKRDLLRTAIKQPLLDKVLDANQKGPLPVILEANDEYYKGKEAAVTDLRKLVSEAGGPECPSIGSDQNPYYKCTLTKEQILAVVKKDDENAQALIALVGAAAKKAADQRTPQENEALTWPRHVVRYLAIRRIWYNHQIEPLIDKSVCTVKADAAQRAFLAEGKDIVWAVIDSGIDEKHEHFKARQTLSVELPIRHCDFTNPDPKTNMDSALVDKFGHGSHVAGIIAGAYLAGNGMPKAQARRSKLGSDNQPDSFQEELTQIAGMAPSCKLVSLKVLDDAGAGDVSNIIAAIDFVQQINDFGRNLKIHGVNLSVGYEFDPLWFACGQSPVCVEVNRLVRAGVIVVVAAGNTGYGVLSATQRATGAGFMLTINDPGNADLAITVGSTHRDAPYTYGVSYFSSKGPTGDGRMKPDLVAPGERILSCCSSVKDGVSGTNTYVEDSGTSMAAPHVSGVIAAFMSIRREYIGNPERVKELFLSTASDLGRNPYFQGKGLVDLMRAIQSV